MVNIELDNKHRLISDSMNYIIEETKVVKDGDRKGEEYKVSVGYYSTLQGALKGYKELKIRTSDAKTINEILEVVKETDNKINEILGGI